MSKTTVTLVLCSLLGCQAIAAQQQSDEQAIRQAESRWRKVLAAQDTSAIGSFYTQDAVYAPQGAPAYRGRNSISHRWAREVQSPDFRLERTPIRIEVARSGDLANEVGTYEVHYRMNDKLQRATGTYITAWKKSNGEWRIASYMWNRDEPCGEQTPAKP
jgi:ketosteroid isomerase-like protein